MNQYKYKYSDIIIINIINNMLNDADWSQLSIKWQRGPKLNLSCKKRALKSSSNQKRKKPNYLNHKKKMPTKPFSAASVYPDGARPGAPCQTPSNDGAKRVWGWRAPGSGGWTLFSPLSSVSFFVFSCCLRPWANIYCIYFYFYFSIQTQCKKNGEENGAAI